VSDPLPVARRMCAGRRKTINPLLRLHKVKKSAQHSDPAQILQALILCRAVVAGHKRI